MSDTSLGSRSVDLPEGRKVAPPLPRPVEALSPPELALHVRALQRAGWERGETLLVEDYLTEYPKIAEDSESVFDLIYHEYLLRERHAGQPDIEDFAARFPQHADALRMQIRFHRAVQAAPPDDLVAAPAAGDRRDHASRAGVADEGPSSAIRGYEVLDEIGFGGMGVVYRARQIETNRVVALKVLSAGAHAGAVQRARFRGEAELIARLQHPNIVQIYEAGEERGCPFLVLEFIGGGSLRDRMRGVPHPPRIAARFLEVVARALDAAHAAGVVHRDLTPGNLLFTSAGESPERAPEIDVGQPKISDFGLAKSFGAEAATDSVPRTLTGDVMGTPAYMSPEQAAGRTREIGPATDIYSLGAILYELLTGRPPFRAVTTVETLQQVILTEPVSLSRLQPGLPRDLETICLKCLQKQPSQRYGRADDLAEDLRRYLAGEPILARPVGRAARLVRWCRRKPMLASLLSLVGLLLVIVVVGSVVAAVRLNQAALDRLAEAKLAEARVHRLDNQLGRGEKSLAALAAAARIRATPEIRDEAIASLARFDLKFDRYGPAFAGLADFSPDLRVYAHHAGSGELVVRHAADDAEVCRLRHPKPVTGARFSPDGEHLVCRWSNDPRIEVWFVGNAEPRMVLADQCAVVWDIGAVNFSVDGQQFAVGTPDGQVRIYRLSDGLRTQEISVSHRIAHVAFHPLRPQLAIATDADLQIRSVDDGRLLNLLEQGAGTEYLSWHPRGAILVASDRDSGLTLWEPDFRRSRKVPPGHVAGGVATAFNHSGTLLFSTGWDGSLRVWDPHFGKPLFATIGSTAYSLRFSADDRYWAGDVADGRIRIWEFPETPAYRRLTPEGAFEHGFVQTLAVCRAGTGRGRLLAAAMEEGVGLWDLRTSHPVGHLPIGKTMGVEFDDSGNLLTADLYGAQVWPIRESTDAAGCLQIGPPERLECPGTLSQLACNADGRVVGLSRLRGGGLVFHRDRPEAPVALAPHDDVRSISLTPDGKLAATGSHNGSLVRIWNADAGTLVHELEMGSSRVAFSPDGRKLLTTGNGLELWSVADWHRLWKGAGTYLSAHAFSPDGRYVAVDAGTGRIILYAADDGRVVAQLDDPYPTALHMLVFAADSRSLVGLSRDLYQMFVWDLEAVTRNLAKIGLDDALSIPLARASPGSTVALTLDIRLPDPELRILDDLAKCRVDLTNQPGNGAILFRLGVLLSKLGRDREAREAFVGAMEAGAKILAPVELAACEIRLGNWTEGLAVLERALSDPELIPARTAGLCNHIAWYLNLAPPEYRDPQKAVACAHRALELDAEGFRFLNILGLALYRQRELPLAIETLKLSLRTSAMPVFDLYILALCHQATGDHRQAADYLSRADYLFETQDALWTGQRRGELRQLREEYVRGLPSSIN